MLKANYHTHTARCHHAVGTDEEYVQAAMAGGFDVLGFSDHTPWPFRSGFVSKIRMGCEDFADYLDAVRGMRQRFEGRLTIVPGLEVEYFPSYRDHMLWLRDQGIEYFILGQHYCGSEESDPYIGFECQEDDGVRRYRDYVIAGIESGLFCYVAHPDLFMRHRTTAEYNAVCEEACRDICLCAKAHGMPVEVNLLGLDLHRHGKERGYPAEPFWQQAAQYGNDVVLGVDAHDPAALADRTLWEDGIAYLEEHHLKWLAEPDVAAALRKI